MSTPIADRLAQNSRAEGDCVRWTLAHTDTGYGLISVGGRNRRAHRVSYELAFGPIPEGLQLDHLCRVRHCINPQHLEAVTPAENTRRAMILITHCPQGHPYSGSNLVKARKGKYRTRVCRTCWNASRARRRARIRELDAGEARHG